MKKLINFLFLVLISVSLFGQLVNETKTLKASPDKYDYSYYSFNQGASDTLGGTQDSAYYTVKLNKHYPADVSWSVTLDTSGVADSANIDVVWQYRQWSDATWSTAKTVAYDGDANGSVIVQVSDSSKINTTILPLTDKVFAREHRIFLKPTTGAGLGTTGDKVVIEKVEFKAYIRE